MAKKIKKPSDTTTLTAKDKKTLKSIRDLADGVEQSADRGRAPYVDIPSRSLSNVRFNRSKRIIEMGGGTNRREGTTQIRIQNFVPVFVLEPHHEVVPREPGIVDEDVDAAEVLLDIVYQCGDGRGITHVAGKTGRSGAYLRCNRHRARLVASYDCDPCAAGRECLRHGTPDSPRAPSHDGRLSREVDVHAARSV